MGWWIHEGSSPAPCSFSRYFKPGLQSARFFNPSCATRRVNFKRIHKTEVSGSSGTLEFLGESFERSHKCNAKTKVPNICEPQISVRFGRIGFLTGLQSLVLKFLRPNFYSFNWHCFDWVFWEMLLNNLHLHVSRNSLGESRREVQQQEQRDSLPVAEDTCVSQLSNILLAMNSSGCFPVWENSWTL